jgi:protein-S-isoprenylcysteine O-methyltransferase Ste14
VADRHFVVHVEERMQEARFGVAYRRDKSRVRR